MLRQIHNIFIYIILRCYGRTVIAESVKLSPAKACPLLQSSLLMEQGGRKAALLRLMGTCVYCGSLKLSCTGICYVISFFSFAVGFFFYLISTSFYSLQASIEFTVSIMQETRVKKPKPKIFQVYPEICWH